MKWRFNFFGLMLVGLICCFLFSACAEMGNKNSKEYNYYGVDANQPDGGGGNGGDGGQIGDHIRVVNAAPYEFRVEVDEVLAITTYSSFSLRGNPLTFGGGPDLLLKKDGSVYKSNSFVGVGHCLIEPVGFTVPTTEKLYYTSGKIGVNFLKNGAEVLPSGGFVQPPPLIKNSTAKTATLNTVYFGRPDKLKSYYFYLTGDIVGGWENEYIQRLIPTEDWKLVVNYTDQTVTKAWNTFWDDPSDSEIPESGHRGSCYMNLNEVYRQGLSPYAVKTGENAYWQLSASVVVPALEIAGEISGDVVIEGEIEDSGEVNPASDSNSVAPADPNSLSPDGLDPDGDVIEEDPNSGGSVAPAGDPNSVAPATDPNSLSPDGLDPDGEIEEAGPNPYYLGQLSDDYGIYGNSHFRYISDEYGGFWLMFLRDDVPLQNQIGLPHCGGSWNGWDYSIPLESSQICPGWLVTSRAIDFSEGQIFYGTFAYISGSQVGYSIWARFSVGNDFAVIHDGMAKSYGWKRVGNTLYPPQ